MISVCLPNSSSKIFTKGARQFVVQEALLHVEETIRKNKSGMAHE